MPVRMQRYVAGPISRVKFSVDAEELTTDENFVVLERKKDDELIAVRRSELSEQDQQFIDDNERVASAEKPNSIERPGSPAGDRQQPNYDSTWKLADGQVVTGRLMGVGRQELVIRRERGDILVNDRKPDQNSLRVSRRKNVKK